MTSASELGQLWWEEVIEGVYAHEPNTQTEGSSEGRDALECWLRGVE